MFVSSAGLANFASKELLTRALTFCLSEDVRFQDGSRFISDIARNPRGRDLAWAFFQENFSLLKER
jgi:hypothetical protein